MNQNQQFQSMLASAQERLRALSPEQISEHSAIPYDRDAQTFAFESFGQSLRIQDLSYDIDPALTMWHHLTILQYMALADGTPLTGVWNALEAFRNGGAVRGQSFNAEIDAILQMHIGSADTDTIIRAAESLGGKQIESNADLSFLFHFAPRFPIRMNLWLADDEFPAACKLLFDQNAEHYLEVEAAGTVGVLLLNMLDIMIRDNSCSD